MLFLNKKIVLIIIILIIILLGVFYFFISNKEEKMEEEYQPQEEITDEQMRQTIISLYYENKETGELMPEGRLIDVKTLLNNPYKILIEMLIAEPKNNKLQSAIPNGTIINNVELKNDILYVDFSKEFIENPDLTVVPGLGFDRSKNRLGYGGGYYDRFLCENNRLITVGLCYQNNLTDKLIINQYDMPVNYIITENSLEVCNGKK